MIPETIISEVQKPIRPESQELLELLDTHHGNPDCASVMMQHALGMDITRGLDFDNDGRARDPVTQFEAASSFEELVSIFCRYGLQTPRDLGAWLDMPCRSLDGRKPFDVLFEGFTPSGFDETNLRTTIEVGSGFFGLSYGGAVALRERFGIDLAG